MNTQPQTRSGIVEDHRPGRPRSRPRRFVGPDGIPRAVQLLGLSPSRGVRRPGGGREGRLGRRPYRRRDLRRAPLSAPGPSTRTRGPATGRRAVPPVRGGRTRRRPRSGSTTPGTPSWTSAGPALRSPSGWTGRSAGASSSRPARCPGTGGRRSAGPTRRSTAATTGRCGEPSGIPVRVAAGAEGPVLDNGIVRVEIDATTARSPSRPGAAVGPPGSTATSTAAMAATPTRGARRRSDTIVDRPDSVAVVDRGGRPVAGPGA